MMRNFKLTGFLIVLFSLLFLIGCSAEKYGAEKANIGRLLLK